MVAEEHDDGGVEQPGFLQLHTASLGAGPK
jgi:hypothetical protein